MASENKEIGDIVKKCKILLLDVAGTTTSINFVKKGLLAYIEENLKKYLESQWETDDVKEIVAALRTLSVEDAEKNLEGVVSIPGEDAPKEEQIEAIVKSVKWQISWDSHDGPVKTLQGLMYKQAYDDGNFKGHVFDDVSAALKLWHSVEDQKVYIFSSGSEQSQKLLFGHSTSGDLTPYIEGYFDTKLGDKQDVLTYTQIVAKIGCKAEDILYLNDNVKEAESARSAGLHAALVSREGNEPLPTEATASFPVIHSFEELTVTNKRKQEEPQDELPAKVAKTDTNDDVTTASVDPEATEIPAAKDEEIGKTDKMEVEEVCTKETETTKEKQETTVQVEEVTDSIEAVGTPVLEIEPVVEEKEEKTEVVETEKMETENEVTEKKEESNDSKVNEPATENNSTVITEIEDISDKNLDDVAEIIEDLQPVVEEPPSQDMEELQSVGEVLEKECDEILSKVDDVTNLDNIPLKPLLNTIAEETMETENPDSNDIVDRILDTELELEMKQCADIDLNTVSDVTDDSTTVKETNSGERNGVLDNLVNETVESVMDEMAVEDSTTSTDETKVDETQKTEQTSNNTPTEESSDLETATLKLKESDKSPKNLTEENKPALDEIKSDEAQPLEKEAMKQVSEEITPVPEKVKVVEKVKLDETVTPVCEEIKPVMEDNEKVSDEVKPVTETVEPVTEEVPMSEEMKSVSDDIKSISEETKPVSDIKSVSEEIKPVTEEIKPVSDEIKSVSGEIKPVSEEMKSVPEEIKSVSEEIKSAPEKTTPVSEEIKMDTEEVTSVTEEVNTVSQEVNPVLEEDHQSAEIKPNDDVKEQQVNGKATNGDAEMVNLNGDASKNEELNSRLSVENGKETVNGSNGDAMDTEQGQGDSKVDAEVSEIKVKTVTTDEPRTDPIEQLTEA